MHFVSEYTNKILVRQHKDVYSQANGEKINTLPALWLQLERGSAPYWAVEQALAMLKFEHRPMPQSSGGANVPIEQYVAYIDTDEWAERHGHGPDIRDKANELLVAAADVFAVTPPVLAAPWRSYDDLVATETYSSIQVAEKNLAIAVETGTDAEYLIAYERANRNDEVVLAAYELFVRERQQEQEEIEQARELVH
jgi:hypothetical protein